MKLIHSIRNVHASTSTCRFGLKRALDQIVPGRSWHTVLFQAYYCCTFCHKHSPASLKSSENISYHQLIL